MSSRRVYRQEADGSRLTSFNVIVKESDLWIAVSSAHYSESLKHKTEQLVWSTRKKLDHYFEKNPDLLKSLDPCLFDADAPDILQVMARAANQAGVGPMAAVAGAVAEEVGCFLLDHSSEVIVENGGDIFLRITEPVRIGIYAGGSSLSGKLALQVEPETTPLGICTSSGTVGPSLSFGKADAAVAVSVSVPLADAMATALGNMVKSPEDLSAAIEFAQSIQGVSGALLISGDKIAVWGEIELQKA